MQSIRKALLGQEEREKKAARLSKRMPCPFYGFIIELGTFRDMDINVCALISRSSGQTSPCPFVVRGQFADWGSCIVCNTPKNKEMIRKEMIRWRVCPEEIYPKKKTSWKGIPFREYLEYVMAGRQFL